VSIGIACAAMGQVTPAGERFCEILPDTSNRATAAKPKQDFDQRRFAGAVLAKKRMHLSSLQFKVDRFQRRRAGRTIYGFLSVETVRPKGNVPHL
jgi:hypothetical protein